jgi:hypothetical protein
MLHENPFMSDIDVDHWRNLQDLVLDSAKEKRRIIIIHESGRILKFVHSQRDAVVRNVERIDQPEADARAVYEANRSNTDFVMVLERRAVERFFAAIQDTWNSDEDLDEYVHRMYSMLEQYPEGIVAWPGPARTRLGLQWRIGSSYEEVKAALRRFVPSNSTAVIGIFHRNVLWASLVLSFDQDRRITVVTTADPGDLNLDADSHSVARNVVAWANERFAKCALGLFVDLDGARLVLSRPDKLAAIKEFIDAGKLVADPIPHTLREALTHR